MHHRHRRNKQTKQRHPHRFARFEGLAYARTSVGSPHAQSQQQQSRAPARRVVRLAFSGGKGGKQVDLTDISWPLLAFYAPRGARGVTLGR